MCGKLRTLLEEKFVGKTLDFSPQDQIPFFLTDPQKHISQRLFLPCWNPPYLFAQQEKVYTSEKGKTFFWKDWSEGLLLANSFQEGNNWWNLGGLIQGLISPDYSTAVVLTQEATSEQVRRIQHNRVPSHVTNTRYIDFFPYHIVENFLNAA